MKIQFTNPKAYFAIFKNVTLKWLIFLLIQIMLFQGFPFNLIQLRQSDIPFQMTQYSDFSSILTLTNAMADENTCAFDLDEDSDVDGVDLTMLNDYPDYNLNMLAMEFGRTDCISEYPEISVPDMTGLTQGEAETAISNAGLTVGEAIFVYSSTTPQGTVVGQQPAAGLSIPQESVVTLYVSNGPEPENPMPQGSFSGNYQGLIPDNAEISAFNPDRFAMITGIIQNESENGFSGVSVSVLNHPEYGSVLTDANGRFSIAVNGGGTLTVKYTMAGFLEAQRSVDVPWKDFAIAKTTVLLTEDTTSSTLSLDGDPDTPFVHIGSSTNDSSGERTPVVVFAGDTVATAVSADGSTTPLTGPLTIRATEFTTPESMPAILPPTSAFTYCVDLSIDEAAGASQVTFSKPVSFFLKNFIGFDVGETIPVGYYNQQQGKWIAELDGKVVRLLDTDTDGVIDSLDADGDNQADDLNLNGQFDDEVFGLDLAGQFSPGETVWRVETSHFSYMDLNLSAQPPSSTAISPNPLEKPKVPDNIPTPPCGLPIGSRIDEREQVFHEDLPLAGSDYMLHYSSNRVKDYLHKINVPVSGETIPASVNSIIVELQVAGNVFTKELTPAPDLSTEFIWDGLDVLGNPVTTTTDATISIGFVYTPTYLGYSSDMIANYGIQRSFALPGDYITAIARDSMAMWKVSKLPLPALPSALEASGLGNGWSLTPHHSLITGKQKILVRGDGTTTHPPEGQNMIWTIAGTGTGGYTPPSGPIPATSGELYYPNDIVITPQGTAYILDRGGYIRKVDTDGMMTVIAGDGTYNYNDLNEGGLAVDTSIPDPKALALGPDASLYVCVYTSYGYLIRRIDPQGIITTVAGDITTDSSWVSGTFVDGGSSPGDGGPATSAYLFEVSDIEVGPDGSIYIAQSYQNYSSNSAPNANVIRKVDTNGIIQTIAGRGPQWCLLDTVDAGIKGIPALDACLGEPQGLSLDTSGNLLMTVPAGTSIVNLASDGLIRTLAGCYGSQACNQEMQIGGPARQRYWPIYTSDLLAAPDGSFYVSVDDYRYTSSYILKVDSTGTVQLFAGQLTSAGYTGDNGPALNALFSYGGPYGTKKGMVLDPEGYLYVTDYANHVVRKIGPKFGSMHPMVNTGEVMIPECPDCPDYGGTGHIFNMGGKHLRTIDLSTGKTLYEFLYDAGNRLIGIIDQFGSVTTINRDVSGKALSITGPYGDITQLSIDASDNLVQTQYPDGRTIQLSYTGSLLTSKIDRENQPYSYTYDTEGRFVSNIDPSAGGVTLGVATSVNQGRTTTTTTVTTAEGRINTYEDTYDSTDTFTSTITNKDGSSDIFSMSPDRLSSQRLQANGMVFTSKKMPDPLTGALYTTSTNASTPLGLERATSVQRSYGADNNSDGLPDTITTTGTVNGLSTTQIQDIQAHNIIQTTPESRVFTKTYDPQTLLINSLSVTGLTDVTYDRDAQGRVKSVTQGERQTAYTYNGAWLASRINDLGQTTSYTRDPMGNITSIELADASTWTFERDGNGKLETITEPDTTTKHRFTHTPTGLLGSYTSPMGAVEYYDYDKDKRPTQREYPSGKAIIWQYNVKGQLTEVQTSEGNSSFVYDPVTGQLTQATSRDGQQVDYTYDGSLLTGAAWTGVIAGDITWEYDNFFRVNRLVYPGGDISLAYDQDGLLTEAGSINITRNADNGLISQITDGSYTIDYGWNLFGEEISKTVSQGSTLYDISYTRDDLGRITQKDETINGATHILNYEYNAVGQLTIVKQDGTTVESYHYDDVGNRIILNNSLIGQNLTATYDADNKIISAGSTTYSYDMDGRLAEENQNGSITLFQYNTDGTLATVTLHDTRVVSYVHDARGRRIARSVDGVRTHAWIYGEGLMPLAEFNGAGSLTKSFIYSSGATPTAFIDGGQTFHIVSDHLGSPRLIVDSTGTVVRQIDYDSFGNVIADTNPGMELPFGFAGGMTDPDHELIRFGVRDYQPSTGRWTARDPILFNGGLNLYGYVGNDPMNRVDTMGKDDSLVARGLYYAVTGIAGKQAAALVKNVFFESPPRSIEVKINGIPETLILDDSVNGTLTYPDGSKAEIINGLVIYLGKPDDFNTCLKAQGSDG